MKNNLVHLYAYQLARLIGEKKIDPVMILECYIDQFNKANTKTKYSFTKFFKKKALSEAEESWKRQKEDRRLSIFDGIPITYKDVIDIKGFPAFAGSNLLKTKRENIKVEDANVVKEAKKRGIITLATTSTVEFAFGGIGTNNSFNFPPNQMLKGNRCPGGSSSGAATSVYSNLVPLAIGTDTAGSIRIPSAWHSLNGFKPTYNLISTKGVLPLSKSYDTVGTISKCIKDTQIIFNILSNNNFEFPRFKSKDISVGIISDIVLDKMNKKHQLIYEGLFNFLSNRGIKFKEINLPEFKIINDIIISEGGLVNYEAWNFWEKNVKNNLSKIDANVSSRFILGKRMSKSLVLKMQELIKSCKKKVYENLDNVDVFFTPTVGVKPPEIKEVMQKDIYTYYNNLILSNTRIANIFNLCAIAMPIKKNNWLSLSIMAKEYNDERLLCVAYEIEKLIKQFRTI